MRYTLLFLLVGLGLAACDVRPRELSATDRSVTYEVGPNDEGKADAMAEEYCKKSGRSARRGGMTEYGSSKQITYQCD